MGNLLASSNPMFGTFDNGIYIFTLPVYYYGLCIISGILAATVLSALLMKRRNMSADFIFPLFLFCIPMAIICTRLFYCITRGMHISKWFDFKSIQEGGLSVIGGVIGGVGTGVVVCLVKKVNFFRAADCVVVTILLAQAIGRWGNFFNAEVYGAEVTDPALQWFPLAVPISPNKNLHGVSSFSDPSAVWHYAFFFYESVINLIGFAGLFTAAWFFTKKPNGILTFAYFLWYGIVRTIMEPLRDPSYILGGKIMWSQVFSILMIVLGACGIITLMLLNYKKEGLLIGSKNGDPCAITEYIPASKDDVPYFSKINILGAKYPPKPQDKKEDGANKDGATAEPNAAETEKENAPAPETNTEERAPKNDSEEL